MNRPHIIYQALWAMRPSRRRRWGGAQDSPMIPLSSQAARRMDCARKNWPSALGRHFE